MKQYRNDNLDKQVEILSLLVTAIAEKNSRHLNVMAIMKKDPLISFDKAVQIGMQETAEKALIQLAALATGSDRIIKMAEDMCAELTKKKSKSGFMYKKRLQLLTQFESIVKELTPPQSIQTGGRVAKD